MKKALPKIILGLVVLAIIGGVVATRLSKRTIMNDTYVNGNTAGNLYNGGIFCENNGLVYFSNPDDGGKLYSMDPSGSNVKKICDDVAMYINADDNYLYYVRNNDSTGMDYSFFSYNNYSLVRIKKTGGKIKILDQDPCIYASLIGNYIYYLHYDSVDATTLYKVKIDGTDRQQVYDYYVFTCSANGQYFYYSGVKNDGNLYRFDTSNDTDSTAYICNCYKPIVTSDSNVFYLDVSQNEALVHTSMNFDNPVTLVSDSVDCYNVYGSYIYYQVFDGDNSRLCMIKNDGSDETLIALGTYKDIHVTSRYVYFMDYDTNEIYYAPTANPTTISAFHPGTGDAD